MSKVDWSKAPEGAEFYADGIFYAKNGVLLYWTATESEWVESISNIELLRSLWDYQPRPTISAKPAEQSFAIHGSLSDQPITISVKSPEWPDEERIDRIGRDRTPDDLGHYNRNADEVFGKTFSVYSVKPDAPEFAQSDLNARPISAADFLSAGLEILSQRGEQYGNDGRECSFPQAAEAFNALTGHNLKGSDICLIIALVKQVRQYAQPSRFHEDSAVDGVNYLALQSELLKKERKQ